MEKTEFLCKYHNLQIRIAKKKEYIRFCDERAQVVPGPTYGERIGSNPSPSLDAPFVRWVYRRIEAEKDVQALEEEAKKVKTTIEEAVAKLDNPEFQQIMIYHYIDWLTWEEIATKTYSSKSTVRRHHSEALEILELPI